jgi:hypothetical protein
LEPNIHQSISYSQWQTYKKCPYSWKLQYKDRIRVYKPTLHTVFGTALHETVQNWLSVIYTENVAAGNKIDLAESLLTNMKNTYAAEVIKNDNKHFATPEELGEFYDDGLAILDYLKANRVEYFLIRGWSLVGAEVPILLIPLPEYPTVYYKGFLDLVLYHENTNTYHIFDIKTSTRGWNATTKADEGKQNQLILYKEYYSKMYNVPVDNIDIDFVIVKRKLYEESQYPQKRGQRFTPPSGPIKRKKARQGLEEFIKEIFNTDGTYQEKPYKKTPSQNACIFCPFADKPEYCDKKPD